MAGAKDYQETLALIAYLFDYPNEAWWAQLSACRKTAAKISTPQNQRVITDLLDYIEAMGQKEYEEFYVRTFEFSTNTNLYLTMHDRTDFGKQAREMLEFKNLFLDNGFDLNKELPDFLPAILELTASLIPTQAHKVLEAARPKIELLKSRFVEAKLAHTFLLDVILTEADELESETA
ncbi:MAG: nitrate reductase molybdenum cofactor assembly chaperone [Selenomonas sp.]|uniref:nitrate reductase molybdenum cofactor assembly chaperone n=1 Tax=Selenomonas sp. TaxID=2053611 RepID=UPI0025E6564E|nr:nitrate reductase molybdenum cofactor assembly chaperone [Selenomonas sp.]MCR5757266.1 nitrate reductase molybdenum cofactor assembly chaperone [Selenomonas sp.]